MLKNNPTGLERAEIERVVENQYSRLLRQHQSSKTLSASKSTPSMGCGEKKRKPRNRLENNCFNCGRKGHRAEDCRSAKKIEKSVDAAADKKGGDKGKSYVCGSEEHFAHKNCVLCRSLEHRTCDCGKRGAEKGAMLAKINVPANSELGLVEATIGAARGDDKGERDSDSGTSFHMSHAQAGMTAYKQAPALRLLRSLMGPFCQVTGSVQLR